MKRNNKSATQPQNETTVYKIGSLVGEIAGKLSNQKDHLIEIAGNAIASVKTAVHDLAEKAKPGVKKAIKKPTKKVAKKSVKRVVKKEEKAATAKKIPATKKIVKKSAKNSVKKVARKAATKK